MPAFCCGNAGAAVSMSSSAGWEVLQVLPGDNRILSFRKEVSWRAATVP